MPKTLPILLLLIITLLSITACQPTALPSPLPAPASPSPAASSSPLFSSGTLPSPSSTSSPTATRKPTRTPSPTHTYGPTRTPNPTRTPVPTQPATPIVPSTIIPPAGNRVQGINYALRFWQGDQLFQWQPTTGEVTTLADMSPWRVDIYTELVYAGDKFLRVERLPRGQEIKPNFTWTTTLELIDPHTGQITPLVEIPSGAGTFATGQLSVSPDHQWIAYVLLDEVKEGGYTDGQVYQLPLTPPYTPQVVAGYTPEDFDNQEHPHNYVTLAPLWTPQNTLIWTDAQGIWAGGLGLEPRLLAEDKLTAHVGYIVVPPHWTWIQDLWSPSGRYLLMGTRGYEGGCLVVVDTHNGGAAEVPDSCKMLGSVSAIPTWLPDDRLLTLKEPPYPGDEPATVLTAAAHIWRFTASPNPAFTLQAQIPLAFSAPFYVDSPHPLANNRLGLLTFPYWSGDEEIAYETALYGLDPNTHQLQILNPVPPTAIDNQSAFWAPDGSGVILQGYVLNTTNTGLSTWWIPADGSPVVNITPIISGPLGDMQWIPAGQE